MKINTIQCADNVNYLKDNIDLNTIDLIYMDPPFNSGRNYDEIKSDEIITGFVDSGWYSFKCANCGTNLPSDFVICGKCGHGIDDKISVRNNSIECFIQTEFVPILKECHRVLKETGTIYVHMDHHAVHYAKIEMDKLFGLNNFRNEIIWYYQSGTTPNSDFGRKHDTILRYSKSGNYTYNFNDILIPYNAKELARFSRTDSDGRRFYWNSSRQAGKYKTYLTKKGKNPTDVWKIPRVQSNESTGYLTQKPEKLLIKIIRASSNQGDLILDPFCGSGTACVIAEKLKRNYIGIDINPEAIEHTVRRLSIPDMGSIKESMPLTEQDFKDLHHRNFEIEIMRLLKGSVTKATGDGGIDGLTGAGIPVQIKQSEEVDPEIIKRFSVDIRKKGKTDGWIVALSFLSSAHTECERLNYTDKLSIELLTLKDVLLINKPGYFKDIRIQRRLREWE